MLEDGRSLAFGRPGVWLDKESRPEPALAVYTGQPYATPRFRELLVAALDRGLHCLIISGGYGLVRPEEPIQRYSAHIHQHTGSVWNRRLKQILPAYVDHNRIRRAFLSVSNTYALSLPRRFVSEEWWGIPSFDPGDQGSALRVVPERVGHLVTKLLASDFEPLDGWVVVT